MTLSKSLDFIFSKYTKIFGEIPHFFGWSKDVFPHDHDRTPYLRNFGNVQDEDWPERKVHFLPLGSSQS
jgi:hypothetical protein